MAKNTESKCNTCGAPVGLGCRFCSSYCKLTFFADRALATHKAKVLKAKSKKKSAKKKATKGK